MLADHVQQAVDEATRRVEPGFWRFLVRRHVQLQQRHRVREQPAVERRRAVRAGRPARRRGVPECGRPGATAGGAIAGAGSVGADANFASARLRIFGAGINYTAGPATVGFAYTNSNVTRQSANVGYLFGDETIEPLTGPLAGGTVAAIKYQNVEVNGKYQFTPAFFVGAQYVYTTVRYDTTMGSAKPKIHSIGLMADYTLSKRTDVYLMGGYQRIAGDATGSSLDQAYVPGAADLSSTSRQLMVHAGIRHKF